MKSIFTLAITLILSLVALGVPPVFADEGTSCTNQYGSTVECPPNQIVVNKKVRYPTNVNLFVENLTSNDTAYSLGDEVEYDVAVTNTSNVNFEIVTVIDILPEGLTFVSGPGRYEAAARKLTYEISNLKAGTTVHNRILAKVTDASKFPQDLNCEVVNAVTATGPGGQSDQDTAALCVQTRVLGVTKLPEAGFEEYAFMIPFLALATIGFGLLYGGKLRRLP
ncbi:MAG TPA: hypothetical protein VJB96_01810 [Patescibacteria group bacterium]|nr:hypothetical protein [Patescibacteria group bacterium]